MAARNQFLGMAARTSAWSGCAPTARTTWPSTSWRSTTPRPARSGVSVADINDTLSHRLGRQLRQRLHRPRPDQEGLSPGRRAARMTPEDLDKWYVRNARARWCRSRPSPRRWSLRLAALERYNGQPSMEIMGQAAPGLSSGDAMQAVEEIIAKLPPASAIEWTGTSFEERRSGDQAPEAISEKSYTIKAGRTRISHFGRSGLRISRASTSRIASLVSEIPFS
jgi:multidrug efflux pump